MNSKENELRRMEFNLETSLGNKASSGQWLEHMQKVAKGPNSEKPLNWSRATFMRRHSQLRQQGRFSGGGNGQPYCVAHSESAELARRVGLGEITETQARKRQFKDLVEAQMVRIEQQQATIGQLQNEIQRLITAANGGTPSADGQANAIGVLCEIMNDTNLNMRRRLRGCESLLSYKVPPAISETCRWFLLRVFVDPSSTVDDKLTAAELQRRCEAPKIMPAIERLVPRPEDDGLTPEERRQQLAETMERRRRHIERVNRENARELAELKSPATD
jgi:hypothetical protein